MSTTQETSEFEAKVPHSPPDSYSGSEATDPLDLRDDEGWEDVEADVESLIYVSFFDDKKFEDIESMLRYSCETWKFDLVHIRKTLSVCISDLIPGDHNVVLRRRQISISSRPSGLSTMSV